MTLSPSPFYLDLLNFAISIRVKTLKLGIVIAVEQSRPCLETSMKSLAFSDIIKGRDPPPAQSSPKNRAIIVYKR